MGRIASFGSAAAVVVVMSALTGCSSEQKANAPPKPGTPAHTWYVANEAYNQGDYVRAFQHFSTLASGRTDYRERASFAVLIVGSGVAAGYGELGDAYEKAARGNRVSGPEFRKRMSEVRRIADTAALHTAEILKDLREKNKELKFEIDLPFPTGSSNEPLQFAKLTRGLPMQPAEHEALLQAMPARGVVRFAAAFAGSPDDLEAAKTRFKEPSRDAAIQAIATNLITVSDLYGRQKLDLPQRGNALCNEALQAIALLPDSKQRKDLEAKANKELKRFKVAT